MEYYNEDKHRSTGISWLVEIFHDIGDSCTPAILFNAISIFDDFMGKRSIPIEFIQLYIITALWISSKFHDEDEYYEPCDLLHICKDKYDIDQLIEAEIEMFFESSSALQIETAIDILQKNIDMSNNIDISNQDFENQSNITLEYDVLSGNEDNEDYNNNINISEKLLENIRFAQSCAIKFKDTNKVIKYTNKIIQIRNKCHINNIIIIKNPVIVDIYKYSRDEKKIKHINISEIQMHQ